MYNNRSYNWRLWPRVSSKFLRAYLYKTSCFWLTGGCALLWNFPQFSIQNLCASFKEKIWKPRFEHQDQTNMASMEQARSNRVFMLPWLWKRIPMYNNRSYDWCLWPRVSSKFLRAYLYKTSCFCLTGSCALLWNFPQFSIQNLCASCKEGIWKLWHPKWWHHWTIRGLFYTKANTKWSSIS